MSDKAPEAEKKCCQGNCVREHPLHCCHFPVTAWDACAQKGYVLAGWRCLYCKKESAVWTMIRVEVSRAR